jgi:hypothetical protein
MSDRETRLAAFSTEAARLLEVRPKLSEQDWVEYAHPVLMRLLLKYRLTPLSGPEIRQHVAVLERAWGSSDVRP